MYFYQDKKKNKIMYLRFFFLLQRKSKLFTTSTLPFFIETCEGLWLITIAVIMMSQKQYCIQYGTTFHHTLSKTHIFLSTHMYLYSFNILMNLLK